MKTLVLVALLLIPFGLLAAQDATPEATEAAAQTRVDEFGVEQVWVPAGCFLMGTSEAEAEYALSLDAPTWASRRLPSEQPQHEVCLTQGYWIDKTEVTNASFQAFVDAGGYTNEELWSRDGLNWLNSQNVDNLPVSCDAGGDDLPRVCVTWYEAEAYATWRGGGLPTEAQWEFAARGPESLIYPWGNEWDPTLANVVDSEESTPVGSFPDGASWVGALDMSGNAMEWVADWLAINYNGAERDDPTGPVRGIMKAEKGGWFGSNPLVARAAYKHFEDTPRYQDHHIGFRIVTAAEEAA